MAQREVTVILGAKVNPAFRASLAKLQASMRRIAQAGARIGQNLSRAVIPLAAVTFDALNFDKAMAEVSTIVNTSAVNMAKLNREVLQLSRELGESPTEVAKALYQAISSGAVDAANANDFLRVAGKAAIAGVAQQSQAVDLLTSAVNAYGLSINEAGRISDIVFKTIELGKTTFAELAQSMGTVLPIGKQLKVPIEELFAALATLTLSGISTDIAITQIRSTLTSLLKPTQQSKAAAAALGIEFGVEAIKAKGLLGVLRDVRQAVGDDTAAFGRLFPNVRAVTAVMALAGESFGEFERITDQLNNSLGAADVAFQKISESVSRQFINAVNQARVALLPIGTAVLELVAGLAKWTSENPKLATTIAVVTGSAILLHLSGIVPLIGGVISLIRLMPALHGGLLLWAAGNAAVSASTVGFLAVAGTVVGVVATWTAAFVGVGVAVFALGRLIDKVTGIGKIFRPLRDVFQTRLRGGPTDIGLFTEARTGRTAAQQEADFQKSRRTERQINVERLAADVGDRAGQAVGDATIAVVNQLADRMITKTKEVLGRGRMNTAGTLAIAQ